MRLSKGDIMELAGYDAEVMTQVLAVVDSISPLNGIVTKYFPDRVLSPMATAGLLWEDEDGDYFEDHALIEWRRDGDVQTLAELLGLEIEILL
jgi:hypothetical protein